jgi:O-antigen/teichoic acid export membrane protein
MSFLATRLSVSGTAMTSEPDVAALPAPGETRGRLGLQSAVASSLLASSAVQLVNVMTGVLLARALGPHGRGELTAILLWPLVFATIGSLGVADSVTFHAARRTAPVGTLVATSGLLGALQSVLLVGIGALVVPAVLSGYGSSTVHLALLFLAVIPLNLATLYLMGILNGLHRYGLFQALRVCVIAASAAGLVALRLADALTVRGAVLVYLAANAGTALVAAVLMQRAERPELRFNYRLARYLLGYGIKSHTSNVSGLLNERLDQLVISIFLAPARLGLYVIAVTMTSITNLVGASVSFVALPAVARLDTDEDRAGAARRYIAATLVLSTVATVPVLLFTHWLIELLFGEAFLGATNVCRVLLVATVALSTGRAVGAVLKAINRPLDAGIAETLALLVTIAALAVLLPAMGIMGAGVASLLAYLASTVFAVHRAARALASSPLGLLLPTRSDWSRWRALESGKP